MRTIDLALLKPYFHGMTTRTGAPFWLGSTWPYMPTVSSVSGCIASSSRSPSVYGQSSEPAEEARLLAGELLGILQRRELDVLGARPVGSTCLSSADSGKPIHGITIDHASTQRSE